MSRYIYEVSVNCSDPSREAEFNDWYNNIHLPDVFELPGFVRAIRCINTDVGEGQAKYITFYEIETDNIDALMKAHGENLGRKREAGRMSDLVSMVNRVIYKQTYTHDQ
jgi:hypothetical protein